MTEGLILAKKSYQKTYEEALPEFFDRAAELIPRIMKLSTSRDVQGLLMDELDVSKQAAAGLGKISVDFLCEEGRAHLMQHGRGWRKVQLPPESQPEGQTLYISRNTGEAF